MFAFVVVKCGFCVDNRDNKELGILLCAVAHSWIVDRTACSFVCRAGFKLRTSFNSIHGSTYLQSMPCGVG